MGLRVSVFQERIIWFVSMVIMLFSCKRVVEKISIMEQLKQTKIVALGDSITYGFPLGKGWIYYLLKNHNIKIVNSGINGETLEQFYNRVQRDVISHRPTYCIIMGGTNDIAQGVKLFKMQNSLLKIISVLQSNNIKPIIGIPILSTAKEIENPLMVFRNYVQQLGYPVIDFASLFYSQPADGGFTKIKSAWLPDQVHPSQQGYEAMAQLAFNRIEEIVTSNEARK